MSDFTAIIPWSSKEKGLTKTPVISVYDSISEDKPWVDAARDIEMTDWSDGLTTAETKRIRSKQKSPPVQIHEQLYLSDARNVHNIFTLEAFGIRRVLNMAGPHAAPPPAILRQYEDNGIIYKEIAAEDDEEYDLLGLHLEEALEFLHSGTAVSVVHCGAGINRSGLIACADFMLRKRIPVIEAITHLRKQRGNIALCNEGFQKQLIALARINDLLGEVPVKKKPNGMS